MGKGGTAGGEKSATFGDASPTTSPGEERGRGNGFYNWKKKVEGALSLGGRRAKGGAVREGIAEQVQRGGEGRGRRGGGG